MMKRMLTLLVFGAVTAGVLSPDMAPAQTMFRPVAVVNDSAITGFDLSQRAKILAALGYRASSEDALRSEALERLIDDRLKMQEAERAGITATEEQIAESIGLIAKRGGITAEKLVAGLKSKGVSEQALRDMISADVAWQQLVRSRFNRRIDPGESEIDAELEAVQARVGVSYRLAEIGLPATDGGRTPAETEALAQQLYESLNQGGDFNAAVRRYSRSPSAKKGGEVGWVPSERLPPDLLNALADLQPGQVAPPTPVAGGVSLLKLLEVRTEGDADPAVDTELRNQVTKRLQNERGNRLAEGLLQELRRDALIEMR